MTNVLWKLSIYLFIHFLANCGKCFGFSSSFTCGCGQPVHAHYMVVETAQEREARGHPLGQATPYAAMGGITGFSSLAEGYLRLDPSGAGEIFGLIFKTLFLKNFHIIFHHFE